MEKLTFRLERETHLIAVGPDRRIRWRWQARKPLYIGGVARQASPEILIVRERLAVPVPPGVGVTDRLIGFRTQTGQRIWHAVFEHISDAEPEIYGRILSLFQPNGAYATGVTLLVDVQTGKTIATFTGDLVRNKSREMIWMNAIGLPPYQGSELYLLRIDPQTLRKQELSLPAPPLPPGVHLDEQATAKTRLTGERIEVIYRGYSPDTRKESYYLARYRWSAGKNQKPEMLMLEKPEWPQ